MLRRQLVKKAIAFGKPERVPVYMFNREQMEGDIVHYGLGMEEAQVSEWGYRWNRLDDGTMGQPEKPVLPEWKDAGNWQAPPLNSERRMRGLADFKARVSDRYILGALGISGFNTYTFLRGFENAMLDFMIDPERAEALLNAIFDFETRLIDLASQAGLDSVHFSDDWGTQSGLIISPSLWRKVFKPGYAGQFARAHEKGLDVWFHSCGNITEIVEDFHELGVDVINISQPNVVDIERVGRQLRGKQCFMVPISYQTISIMGTPEDIRNEARRLFEALGTPDGGFIGYVEDYRCMGMSETNFRACVEAFGEL